MDEVRPPEEGSLHHSITAKGWMAPATQTPQAPPTLLTPLMPPVEKNPNSRRCWRPRSQAAIGGVLLAIVIILWVGSAELEQVS